MLGTKCTRRGSGGGCPAEDCGAIWRYYGLLEALRDPKHPEYEELTEWVGGEFDPYESLVTNNYDRVRDIPEKQAELSGTSSKYACQVPQEAAADAQ